MRNSTKFTLSVLVMCLSPTAVLADAAAEMARKAQDPLGDVQAIMTDNTVAFGGGPEDETAYGFQIQPVYAIENDSPNNMLARAVIPVVGVEPGVVLPPIGPDTAQDIARKVLAPLFKDGKEVMANRTRSYMYSAFQLGLTAANSARHADAPDFGLTFNPVTVVPREGKESAGSRTLDKAEVKRLWQEIGTRNNMTKDSAIAVKLILSTGQRVEEVLHATWKEFDLEGKTWTLPAERRKTHWKVANTEPHIIPLTDLHIELLTELQGMARRQKYLFPDANGKAPRKTDGLQQAVKRYCLPGIKNGQLVRDYSNEGVKSDRLPFEYFTPRNLRRTFKTLAGEAGLSKEIRDRLQGHSQSDLSSTHYDRYDYLEEKQKAMQKWCNWLSRLVNRKKGTVVPIREAG